MPKPLGRSLRVSLPRRLVIDFLRASRNRSLITVERRMKLAALGDARAVAVPRPGWVAMFVKAYAIVAARHAELRRAYLPYPWARFYEHAENIAAVIVGREIDGEEAILPALLRSPDHLTLCEVDSWLRSCKERPLHEISSFRRALRIGRLPWPIRQLCWWIAMDWWGKARARWLGTFGVSVTASLGATTVNVISPWTTALNYAPFEPDGSLMVRLSADHRVLDGAIICRVLEELEQTLTGTILSEVRGMRLAEAA